MTATDELRRLLDEHGVEYTDASYKRKVPITAWCSGGATFCFVDDVGQADLHIENPTPEQAIAATLEHGTCKYVIEDNMNETEGMGDVWFRCTSCGTRYDYYADEWLLKMPYCPKCGCEVER